MLPITRFRSVLACAAFCLFAVVGCSGKKPVTVKGNVLLPKWNNVKLAEQDLIQVTFDPEAKGGTPVGAKASLTDGSFSAQAAPGKYKVSVKITPYPGSEGSEKRLELVK